MNTGKTAPPTIACTSKPDPRPVRGDQLGDRQREDGGKHDGVEETDGKDSDDGEVTCT